MRFRTAEIFTYASCFVRKVRAGCSGQVNHDNTYIHICGEKEREGEVEHLPARSCRLRKQEASRRLFANLTRAQVDPDAFRRLSLSFDGGRITRLAAGYDNNGKPKLMDFTFVILHQQKRLLYLGGDNAALTIWTTIVW